MKTYIINDSEVSRLSVAIQCQLNDAKFKVIRIDCAGFSSPVAVFSMIRAPSKLDGALS